MVAARRAREKGAKVIAIVNNEGSALAASADAAIVLRSGAEVIAGSTRMGAGTAQKAALNLLSTLTHIRLGAVHDGLMVNVQAGNAKLKRRAARIVSEIAGVDEAKPRRPSSRTDYGLSPQCCSAPVPHLPRPRGCSWRRRRAICASPSGVSPQRSPLKRRRPGGLKPAVEDRNDGCCSVCPATAVTRRAWPWPANRLNAAGDER